MACFLNDDLLLCVLCTQPLKRQENPEIYYVPGCSHAFCYACKHEFLNNINAHFLHTSLLRQQGEPPEKSCDNTTEAGNEKQTAAGNIPGVASAQELGFRCPVCLEVFSTVRLAESRIRDARTEFSQECTSHLHKFIYKGYIDLRQVPPPQDATYDSNATFRPVLQLCCREHKGLGTAHYCRDCHLPLCPRCFKKHKRAHTVVPLEDKRRECLAGLEPLAAGLQAHVRHMQNQKARLRELRDEQEWLHRTTKADIERRVLQLIDLIRGRGHQLLAAINQHRDAQLQLLDQTAQLCDYSMHQATKLTKACKRFLQQRDYSNTGHAELILNYDALSSACIQSLDSYSKACTNNAAKLAHYLKFHEGSDVGEEDTLSQSSGVSETNTVAAKAGMNQTDSARNVRMSRRGIAGAVGYLRDETIKLESATTTEQHCDSRESGNSSTDNYYGGDEEAPPPPDPTPRVSRLNLGSTEIKPFPQLVWSHTISNGFDERGSNPNLAGACYLPNGNLLVAEKDGIQIYDSRGQPTRQFEQPPPETIFGTPMQRPLWPQDIAVFDEDHVVFSDRHAMTLYIYTHDGRFVNKMRHELFRRSQQHAQAGDSLNFETKITYDTSAVSGVCVLPTGQLAVVDSIQCYVHLLDPERETIVHSFGGPGDLEGGSYSKHNLRKPTFVTLTKNDPSGRLLVTDAVGKYIKLYSLEGEYHGRFRGAGHNTEYKGPQSFPGLENPGAVIVDPTNGDLLVANTDPHHALVHFSKRGEYLRTLTVMEGSRKKRHIPFALTLDSSSGRLAMTHKAEGCVNVVQLYG